MLNHIVNGKKVPMFPKAQAHIPPKLPFDIALGVSADSQQYGLIGESAGRKIAIDLNHPQTIISTGLQGSGKSYTCGSILEMSTQKFNGINYLQHEMATVVFHFSETQTYTSESCSMIHPNDNAQQVRELQAKYGARPSGLNDVIILCPKDKVEQRQEEHPDIQVLPLQFSSKQLHASHWKILMGAAGNDAAYLRYLNQIIRFYRNNITLDMLKDKILKSGLNDNIINLAMMRLMFAEQFICEDSDIHSLLKPGRLVIVDIRDELTEKNEALGLFIILLNLFSESRYQGKPFNKVIMFDECHKYINNPSLVGALTEAVREMRHRGTSVILASQDPQSIPTTLIELASIILMHKFNSPQWLKHLQLSNSALLNVSPEKLNTLKPGEAYIWASKSTDIGFSRQANKIMSRPRVTKHGGDTLTAIR
ncbi:hypothetical protein SAMN03092900_0718 [Thiomicrospira sp. ALE5]|nr:hypothetical protein SAMN03092900_0718 [Thiomicrospira sp. ALE5]